MNAKQWRYEFGENLEALLREYPMTQKELADATGLTKAAISNYVLGKRIPTVEAVLAIAYALDCTTDDLIDLSGPIDR